MEVSMNRICVAGIGGIGGYVGGHLGAGWAGKDRTDRELSFIARGETLRTIQAQGLTFISPQGEKSVVHPDHATDNPGNLPMQDLIILCVKGYHLSEICTQLKPIVGEKTAILPLLNGIDIYDRIRRIVDRGIILPGCIYISSTLQSPGVVIQTGGKGNIITGYDPARKDFDPKPLQRVMEEAAIPFSWEEDPFPALWNKYIFIASFALVTGMSGKTMGGVLADPVLRDHQQHIMEEIIAIAEAKGYRFPPNAIQEVFAKGEAFPYETKTSYQRDLEVPGKPNEGDLFGGTILRMGKELGIPTPWTEKTVRAIEQKQ
jgi:2-dehydropantoate 2-reductase